MTEGKTDTRILLLALDQAYALLDEAAGKNVLPKDLQVRIRKMLPPRFANSFAALKDAK